MKYVKYFEAFNEDDFDPDVIAQNVYQYSREWPKTHWGSLLSAIDISSDQPTLSQIQSAVENLIDEAKGSKIKSFFRRYDDAIKYGKLNIKLEEVEDLFLDIPHYTITKSNKFDNQDIFNILVDIKKVSEDELQQMNNHIYGTVRKRLTDSLFIKRVTVLREDNGEYDIKIRLFENTKSKSKSSEDDFINTLTNALRNLRGGQPEDDPDYEG